MHIFHKSFVKMVALFIFSVSSLFLLQVHAEPFSLTMEQRRTFLHYYSPIIFKCADEDKGREGYDWISNFDYDQDGIYYNNKKNWETGLSEYVQGTGNNHWQIRPTLYTFLIEYMQNGQKNLVLFYHVYHPKDRKNIHDWERIEIRLENVTENPGNKESVKYVVITTHILQDYRQEKSSDLNFLETQFGKHVLIHQSKWNGYLELYKNELRYITEPLTDLYQNNSDSATAKVNGFDAANYHYIFVDQADKECVEFFNAKTISPSNALLLASGEDNRSTVTLNDVIRLQYELQDVADIVSSQWEENNNDLHWNLREYDVKMRDPVFNEAGNVIEVPGGDRILKFITGVKRNTNKKGYVGKAWFWGRYSYGNDAPTSYGFYDPRRMEANGFEDCIENEYYWQHDYFAHNGEKNPLSNYPVPRMSDFNEEEYWYAESGEWLKGEWYREENGGFDGRWMQLFPD